MTLHRRRRGVLALLATAALLTTACSESTPDDGAGTASGEGGGEGGEETRTTRGVTDSTITVGGVVYDVYFGDARVGVEARIAELNEAGGVHGRTIEVIEAENDNNEATRGQEAVQRLVEQEEVFALLPVLSGQFGGGDYIVENQIPTFGWGTHPAFCGNDVAFGFTGCVSNPSLEIGSNALGTVLEEQFGTTDMSVAFIGEDNDSSRGGLELLAASVEDKGFDVVMNEASLPAPPDVLGEPSPFVTSLMTADDGGQPDIIYIVATLSGTAISDALQNAGYEGTIITPSYSPLLLGAPGYDGVFVNTQFSMDPEVEANAAMLEAVQAVAPDQQLNLAVSAGYWSTDLFIKALEETGEDLTVENLLATLNSGDFTFEVPNVVGESTWPENHEGPVPCAAMTEVDGEEFIPTIPLVCGETITVG
ncbi:ABC transporter substrate-binding protein [Iamia majanohamensis]|uniref:ABC transporter substrate-binding protein n=1 Tax=Iamia majanohamensis TaxID=467976 RepID=A0AAE9YGI8_9ACTN|nr:ABC transporter substrate-binding protein [Iamia majanohamensis]WCO68072.1 ABC transporter substrate-binding protein [Iamia majanohamensis]